MLPTAKYESIAEFQYVKPDGILDLFEVIGINSFYLIRTPLLKIAPFGILTCSIPPEAYVYINEAIKNTTTTTPPTVHLKFGTSDQNRRNMNGIFTNEFDTGNTFDFVFAIVHDVSRAQLPSVYGQVVPVTFYVVPLELYEIDKGTRFNKKFSSRPIDVLDQYETHLSSTFAGAFTFERHVSNINNFVYESIIMKSTTDLKIPYFLLSHYKLLNHFGYYFFDIMVPYSKITGLLIELSNPNIFPIFNSHESDKYDLFSQLKVIDIMPLENHHKILRDTFNCSYTVKTPESAYTIDKTVNNKTVNTFGYSSPGPSSVMPPNRSFTRPTVSTTGIRQTVPAGESINLYAPDNKSQAEMRYNNILELLQNNDSILESLYIFEARGVHIDALQFNKRYVLDREDYDDAHYVPISIVNKFLATEVQTKTVEHSVDFQALRFTSAY